MKPKLEIACFNLQSAIIAQRAGAHRIELCRDASFGGISPAISDAEEARQEVKIDLYVMIRPRGGNFIYSDSEFKKMQEEIIEFKQLGFNGFVFGILNESSEVDVLRNRKLVELAYPLPCTFHRAFDNCRSPLKALEEIITCGFKTILSSGQKASAVEGIDLLELITAKSENRITIMPGGKVRSSNIDLIHKRLKAHYYHSSAIMNNSDVADFMEVQNLINKLI